MVWTSKSGSAKSGVRFLGFALFLIFSTQLQATNFAPANGISKPNVPLSYTQLYQYNQDLLWFKHQKLNLSGLSLLSLLADLGVRKLAHLNSDELADIKATDVQLTQHLYDISMLFNGHQLEPRENPTLDIITAVQNKKLANYVDSLLPQFNEVVQLRTAITKFRRLSQLNWPNIYADFNPSLGQGHPEVIKIRTILFWLGDIKHQPLKTVRSHIYDPELVNAVKRFQSRHRLPKNGKLDPMTITALNRKPEERIKVLQINLWRWLSLPSVPPSRYVLINIPSYHLHLFESGREIMDMRVIVGQPQHPTPIMVTEINRITINPTWTPTANIIKNDLVPIHQRDKNYLLRKNFMLMKGYGKNTEYKKISSRNDNLLEQLKGYRLVQAPGKNNALGKYRFNIPNFHSVYLHDTPAKSLFAKSSRSLSHGCVRLQHPKKLAQYILATENPLSYKKITNIHNNTRTKHLTLSSPVPVYITYQSVWITATNRIYWHPDIYQLDIPHSDATVSNQVLARN